MASGLPAFASTQENTNFVRLCRLLVDFACTVLCDTFNSIHPPANLHVVLSSASVFSTVLKKEESLKSHAVGKAVPSCFFKCVISQL